MYETVRRLESDQVSARAPGKDREHPGVVCVVLNSIRLEKKFLIFFSIGEMEGGGRGGS